MNRAYGSKLLYPNVEFKGVTSGVRALCSMTLNAAWTEAEKRPGAGAGERNRIWNRGWSVGWEQALERGTKQDMEQGLGKDMEQ